MYTPKPTNTDNITLPAELLALTEQIAANCHDVWAAGRIADGWTLGEIGDPTQKITPLLVPYEELPESEKEYDRRTALESIKLVLALGFCILPRQSLQCVDMNHHYNDREE